MITKNFERTHTRDLKDIKLPDRDKMLLELNHRDCINLQLVCFELGETTVQKIRHPHKNITSELYYGFAVNIVSKEEIDEIVEERFGIKSYKENDKK